MTVRHEDSAVSHSPRSSGPGEQARIDVPADIVSLDTARDATAVALPPFDADDAAPAWQEAVQPLTAVVARAEVINDLIQSGEIGAASDQLGPLQESVERLLVQIRLMRSAFPSEGRPSA
jgi:hypothetical protein